MSQKYAIVNAFGRQFRVQEGDKITANYIKGEVGQEFTFDDVFLVSDGTTTTVGQPKVEGAKVVASLEEQTRAKKVIVFKYLKQNRSKKMRGHKQPLSVLRIKSIQG